jgi:hypothetical protein
LGNHEIFPYYVVFAFLLFAINADLKQFFYFALAVTVFSFVLLKLPPDNYLDFFQIVVVFLTIFFLNSLSLRQKQAIAKSHFFFICAIVIFIVLQRIFPDLIDFNYNYLVHRDYSSEKLAEHTGGAPGISPEPAYMASFLLGGWLYILKFSPKLKAKVTFIVGLGIALTASLSGALVFLVSLFIINLSQPKYILGIIFWTSLVFSFYFMTDSLVRRSGEFFELLSHIQGINILYEIDTHFGSYRLVTLVDPLSKFGCGSLFCPQYSKGYSAFADLYYKIAPLHFIFLLFFLRKFDRFRFTSLFLFIFYGPVLNWMLYSGVLDDENI